MNTPRKIWVCALLACGTMSAARAAADDAKPELAKPHPAPAKVTEPPNAGPARGKEDAAALPWLKTLSEGYRHAMADRKPLLVRAGAKWCAPCRKLASDLPAPAVQAELGRWTLVYLDVDDQPSDAEQLGVVGVPALRILSPGGQRVAEHDGYLAPDQLIDWLKKHYDDATAAADEALLDSGEPDAAAVSRLIGQLQQRNPALREAAIRRLAAWPGVSREAVVKVFCDGSLTARLAALDVLEQWQAPVAGLDPWQPESFTPARLARLEKWTAGNAAVPAAAKRLSAERLTLARQQIQRMLAADEAEAAAIRHRLAALGQALLPEVYAGLKDAATDQDHRRLLALRYRLVAGDALVLRWPGGLERLADPDPRVRQKAAEELAKLATGDDQPLLSELFADADPLVREISLRGLQHVGGPLADAALVKLLADPEPNVRAAVLKQLEESPDAAMTPAVVEYLKTEKDPDLVCHGIRFLEAAKGGEALKCLMSLLKHESWQVRAEAAAGIGKLREGDGYGLYSRHVVTGPDGRVDAATQLQVDSSVALLDVLNDRDAFVVAKAVEGLSGADLAVAVEPLVKAAAKHPDLAVSVLKTLAAGSNTRQKAIPHLRRFCASAEPRIRAAAIAALCVAAPDDAAEELRAALADRQTEVRTAGASALFNLLEQARVQTSLVAAVEAHGVPLQVAPAAPAEGLFSQLARFLAGGSKAPAKKKPAEKPAAGGTSHVFVNIDRITLTKPAKKAAAGGSGQPFNAEPTATTAAPAKKPAGAVVQPPAPGPKKAGGETTQKKAGRDGRVAPAKPSEEPDPRDQWLLECYAGRHRGKWTGQLAAPLAKMLAAGDPRERLSAAMALVPLGKADAALPALTATVRANPELLETAQEVLPWLVWEQRRKTFQQFRGVARGEDAAARLIYALAEAPDRRAADTFWEMLADPKLTAQGAALATQGLMTAYLGNRYYDTSSVPRSDRRELAQAAAPRAAAGGQWQRRAALALLAAAAADEAAEAAAKMAADPRLPDALRTDAFQVQLVTQPADEARKSAVAALQADNAPRKKLALTYLIQGAEELRVLPGGFFLGGDFGRVTVFSGDAGGKPIVPKPPAGIKAEHVRGLLADKDAEVAARAGYVLALLGEPEGLGPLLRYWRQQGKNRPYDQWNKLVYRAIAVADDPKYIPVLREIYGKLQAYEMREFYWTIRIMSGPEILKFRKEVRDKMSAEGASF